MAYTNVRTVNTGDGWTARDVNTYLRDNFAAGIPDLMTTKGDIVAATGADAADRLGVGANGYYLSVDPSASVGLGWKGFERVRIDPGSQVLSGSAHVLNPGWYRCTTLDTEDWDTSASFASDRFTCVRTGYYLIGYGATFVHSSGGFGHPDDRFYIGLYKNATLATVLSITVGQKLGFHYYDMRANPTVLKLTKGDYIDCYIYTSYGDAYGSVLTMNFPGHLFIHYIGG